MAAWLCIHAKRSKSHIVQALASFVVSSDSWSWLPLVERTSQGEACSQVQVLPCYRNNSNRIGSRLPGMPQRLELCGWRWPTFFKTSVPLAHQHSIFGVTRPVLELASTLHVLVGALHNVCIYIYIFIYPRTSIRTGYIGEVTPQKVTNSC